MIVGVLYIIFIRFTTLRLRFHVFRQVHPHPEQFRNARLWSKDVYHFGTHHYIIIKQFGPETFVEILLVLSCCVPRSSNHNKIVALFDKKQ